MGRPEVGMRYKRFVDPSKATMGKYRKAGRICVECSRPISEFATANTRYCSAGCGRVAQKRRDSLHVADSLSISIPTKGAFNELRVAVDLMGRGIHVFRALSPGCPCDLIAWFDDQIVRVEVKTIHRRRDGSMKVVAEKYKKNIFDVIAGVAEDGEIVYVPDIFPKPSYKKVRLM
jgi:hypothetical protein